MTTNDKICHGQFDGMMPCTEPANLSKLSKSMWRLKTASINMLWHLKTDGFWKTLKFTFSKFLKFAGIQQKRRHGNAAGNQQFEYQEVLNLKPGELVEVKPEQEIIATLDEKRKNKGLLWMAGMQRSCGQRFRVYKRLEIILLESTGEYRKMKNTVLLEGVMCDGMAFNGCDRSCFHYWREAWLKRVEESGDPRR